MSVTAMLRAPSDATAPRHVWLAIGSGFTGLAAIKALKLAQLNITDAAVFVGGIAVRWLSHLVRLASPWTPILPAVITSSVLVALAVIGVADIVKLIAAEPSNGQKYSAFAQPCGIRNH